MSFGSALRDAFNAASEVAKHAARSALASAQSAAAAAANGLTVIADVAVAGVGELINLRTALAKVAYASAYKLVSTPYRVAEGIFSDSRPAGTSVTHLCPLRDKERVFTAEYRRELIGSEFAGAGNDVAVQIARDAFWHWPTASSRWSGARYSTRDPRHPC